MNKKIYLLISLLALAALVSCDKIEEPYKNVVDDDFTTDVTTRKVLLEDYTGHTCVNCPAAAKIASDLKALYGDRLVIIGVHAGHFAEPTQPPFTYDMTSPVGNAWDNHFAIQGYPSGIINRQSPEGQYIEPAANWSTRVAEIIDIPTVADLVIDTDYEPDTRSLSVSVSTRFLASFDQSFRLQLVLTEDNIIGPQLNNNSSIGPTPVIEDFNHKHVLRTDLNGFWGENLVPDNTSPVVNEVYEHTYSINLKSDWNEENISVVAFVYEVESYEIYQAEEKAIMP